MPEPNWEYKILFMPSEAQEAGKYKVEIKFRPNKDKPFNPLFGSWWFSMRFNPAEIEPESYKVLHDSFKDAMIYEGRYDNLWIIACAGVGYGTAGDGDLIELTFVKKRDISSPPAFQDCVLEEGAQGWNIPLKILYQIGDVNTDGFVTMEDVDRLVKYVFGIEKPILFPHYLADVNGDHKITFMDCLKLLQKVR